jgi:hypothetical protein
MVNSTRAALAPAPKDHSGAADHVMLEMPATRGARTISWRRSASPTTRDRRRPADNYWSPSTRVVLTPRLRRARRT